MYSKCVISHERLKAVPWIGPDLRDCNHMKYLGQPVVVKLWSDFAEDLSWWRSSSAAIRDLAAVHVAGQRPSKDTWNERQVGIHFARAMSIQNTIFTWWVEKHMWWADCQILMILSCTALAQRASRQCRSPQHHSVRRDDLLHLQCFLKQWTSWRRYGHSN